MSRQIPAKRPTISPIVHSNYIYASLYRDVRPTFVVDISDQFEGTFGFVDGLQVAVYGINRQDWTFLAHAEIRALCLVPMGLFYGMLGGVTYAEPFVQKEVGLVDDVMAIPVKSI